MADREIVLSENGAEYYKGKLSVNECYFRGRIFKEVKAAVGKGPVKFSVTVSNGKKKDSDEWLPSTFVNCLAWQELGQQIADRYAEKDEIEIIAKYQPHSYNKVTYPEFVVREVIRMKPETETADNPYPQGGDEADSTSSTEENEDDLPF